MPTTIGVVKRTAESAQSFLNHFHQLRYDFFHREGLLSCLRLQTNGTGPAFVTYLISTFPFTGQQNGSPPRSEA